MHVTQPAVGQWCKRFRVHRLEGLPDEPRPGAPRSRPETPSRRSARLRAPAADCPLIEGPAATLAHRRREWRTGGRG
ncbi:MAG: hypothetical protein C0504_05160 [Candidatus Solibacter sp.]|nr:hypothetical protein [Candidatus Solibacter sp.]